MWRWLRKMRKNVGVQAAKESRIAAEQQWQREQAVTVRPLAEMYRENHIAPLLDRLVQKRRDNDSGTGST